MRRRTFLQNTLGGALTLASLNLSNFAGAQGDAVASAAAGPGVAGLTGGGLPAKVRGVNLGGWLVLEKWMVPEVYEGSDAPDEYSLCLGLGAQAKARLDEDYEELAAAADKKKKLTAEQEVELTQLWKKLVKLYHPDRFAGEPDKLETYHQLTAAINLAKDAGDMETLREIADDPHGFILRQGWVTLDFKDVEELAQLQRLHETLQKEIAEVAESLKELRASPDYELRQLAEKRPGALDELAAERAKQLEIENAELELQADRLAKEIKKMSGQSSSRII